MCTAARKSDICQEAGLGRRYPSLAVFQGGILGKPSRSKPSEIEEFVHQLRKSPQVWEFSGLLLGLSLYSYHVRELLVCWLYFSVLFVCVTLLLLLGVLGVYAGECVAVWARSAMGMTPVLVLASTDLRVKIISAATKLKYAPGSKI